jgi:hypothetical protein
MRPSETRSSDPPPPGFPDSLVPSEESTKEPGHRFEGLTFKGGLTLERGGNRSPTAGHLPRGQSYPLRVAPWVERRRLLLPVCFSEKQYYCPEFTAKLGVWSTLLSRKSAGAEGLPTPDPHAS